MALHARGSETLRMGEAELAGLVDAVALTAFLRQSVPGDDASLAIEKHEAGFSNETFYVTRGEQRWVLRRPPRGDLLPTAHDVLREYHMISALYGSAARVPRPVIACEDGSVIGAPFYLMDRVDGIVVQDEFPAVFDPPAQRQLIGEELIDALVELHSVDCAASALAGLGRPQGYLERQLRRWSGQLDLTLPRTRPLPGIGEATDWLRANLPQSGPPTVVHGDYKLDNTIYRPERPARLAAILDWEMATLGDPLTDLAWCLSYWGPTGEDPSEMAPGSNLITMGPGFASREELLARYEERSGRSMRHFQFYLCFAVWKLAIIMEGLYMHYLSGTAPNRKAAEMEWRVPRCIERMHRIIAGEL
jgi:aminoglycoside phosphotransferase (APT) family kinase protein